MTSPTWDPETYARFSDERARPFLDLTRRIRATDPRIVVDLGCGSGELTATLAHRWRHSRVTGLDSSTDMVEKAALTSASARVHFTLADIGGWRPDEETDVVVSNAALQWVPDHRRLLVEWASALSVGAWLAFQVPGNFDAPSHALMRDLAASPRWRRRLDGVLRHEHAVEDASGYLALLARAGLTADAWETTYLHVLSGVDPVLEWVRGTGLRPVLQALGEDDSAAFEAEYAALLREAYPSEEYGTVYAFRRVFCVSQKV